MPTAYNAILHYEAGQTAVALAVLSNSGDHIVYNSADTIISGRSGYAPTVTPQGLVTGCVITPAASGTENLIDVSAGTAYIDGVLTTVEADTDVSCTRAVTTDTHIINSIVISAAAAIVVEAGTDATAFSDTRGGEGGPVLVTVDSIEIGWVKFSAIPDAAVTSSEISQIVGTNVERYDYPGWTVKYARVSSGVLTYGGVDFDSALPLIHAGPLPKEVWASYYTPSWSEVPKASDFVPAETSHSVSSKQVYGATIGSKSSSLAQGSFNVEMNSGIYEGFERLKDELIWLRFRPDRLNTTPYLLTQGYLGLARKFPAGDSINAACTLTAETASFDVLSE